MKDRFLLHVSHYLSEGKKFYKNAWRIFIYIFDKMDVDKLGPTDIKEPPTKDTVLMARISKTICRRAKSVI